MRQLGEFLPFILILLVFWFLLIRPQRRRQAEMRALQQAAKPGTQVVLTSGVFGTIAERTDDHVLVEIADGVVIKVLPAAIGQTVHPVEPDEASDDADRPVTPDSEES